MSAFLNWSVFGTQNLAEFLLGPVRELVIGYLIGKSWVSFVLLNGFVSESELSKSELVLLYGGVVLVELSHPVNEWNSISLIAEAWAIKAAAAKVFIKNYN